MLVRRPSGRRRGRSAPPHAASPRGPKLTAGAGARAPPPPACARGVRDPLRTRRLRARTLGALVARARAHGEGCCGGPRLRPLHLGRGEAGSRAVGKQRAFSFQVAELTASSQAALLLGFLNLS